MTVTAGLLAVPGVVWSTESLGDVGVVTTLADAQTLEHHLLEAWYTYSSCEISRRAAGECCEIKYTGPNGAVWLRYQPRIGEDRWRWQILVRDDDTSPWKLFRQTTATKQPRSSYHFKIAEAQYPYINITQRPVFSQLVELKQIVEGAGAKWLPRSHEAHLPDAATETHLTERLTRLGFRLAKEGQDLCNLHTKQWLRLVGSFD